MQKADRPQTERIYTSANATGQITVRLFAAIDPARVIASANSYSNRWGHSPYVFCAQSVRSTSTASRDAASGGIDALVDATG